MSKTIYQKRPEGAAPDSVDPIDKETVSDSHLMDFPRQTPTALRNAVGLLLLASSREERYLVGLHYLHGVALPAIAKRLQITPAQAADLHHSVIRRRDYAAAMQSRSRAVRQNLSRENKKEARK